jgi:hypothetical protein
VRTLRSGENRFATNSVWEVRLHDECDLHSDNIDINDFLTAQLQRLQEYKDIFWELRDGGTVRIAIHLKLLDSRHTAFVIKPEVMRTMADCGIDLEVEISCFLDDTASAEEKTDATNA